MSSTFVTQNITHKFQVSPCCEKSHLKSFCELVKKSGLEGFYQEIDKLNINQMLSINTSDLLHLASHDKEQFAHINQLTTEEKSQIMQKIAAEKPRFNITTTNKAVRYQTHPEVKEKNGEGMKYLINPDFKCWDNTVTDHPKYIFIPKTIVGLQNLMKYANKHGLEVGKFGYTHSSEKIYGRKNQILVSMIDYNTATHLPANYPEMDPDSDLQGIELVGEPYIVDGKKKIKCKIGASTCNYHFQDWVHDPNRGNSLWALAANVVMTEITFAGSNATMCHGGGINTKTLADYVTEIEFVNVKGELQRITDKELIKAAAGSFGLLGLVTSLTLELDEMTYANIKNVEKKLLALSIPRPTSMPVTEDLKQHLSSQNLAAFNDKQANEKAFQEIFDRIEKNYYSEIFWFPLQNKTWINIWNNDGKKEDAIRYPKSFKLERAETYLANLTNNVLGDKIPCLRKIQTKLMSGISMLLLPHKKNITSSLEDMEHFHQGIQNLPTLMLEIEIPIPDKSDTNQPDWSICQKAWWSVIDTVYNKENYDYMPMRTALEMRITDGSSVDMAAQASNKRTCAIEILTPATVNRERWEKFAQEIFDNWSKLKDDKGNYLKLRPHWAKRFDYLNINRNKDWLKEWNAEQINELREHIKDDSDTISMPMTKYLKVIAYKDQIPVFKHHLQKICQQGGYELKDLQSKFSNPLLDYVIFDKPYATRQQHRPQPRVYRQCQLSLLFKKHHPRKTPVQTKIDEFDSFHDLENYADRLEQKSHHGSDEQAFEKAIDLRKLLNLIKQSTNAIAIDLIDDNLDRFNQPRGLTTKIFQLETTTHEKLLNLREDINNFSRLNLLR